jgi:hypothetical protein
MLYRFRDPAKQTSRVRGFRSVVQSPLPWTLPEDGPWALTRERVYGSACAAQFVAGSFQADRSWRWSTFPCFRGAPFFAPGASQHIRRNNCSTQAVAAFRSGYTGRCVAVLPANGTDGSS